jgi:hypothetical protein
METRDDARRELQRLQVVARVLFSLAVTAFVGLAGYEVVKLLAHVR